MGICVGAPNGITTPEPLSTPPNLIWKGIPLYCRAHDQKFGIPCALTKDANAAAMGEMMHGAARGMKDFIMITLGTGVEAALFQWKYHVRT